MVQLIALMYKDQHENTLQKLLSQCFEAPLSESSEDNESNTSPQNRASKESSPIITSDPTSDSSDNCSNGKRKDAERVKANCAERNKNNTDICNKAAEAVRAAQNSKESNESDVWENCERSDSIDSGILSQVC